MVFTDELLTASAMSPLYIVSSFFLVHFCCYQNMRKVFPETSYQFVQWLEKHQVIACDPTSSPDVWRLRLYNFDCNVCQALHYVQSPPDKKPVLLESARTANDVWVMLKSVKIWLKIVATILGLPEADASNLHPDQVFALRWRMMPHRTCVIWRFGHLVALGSWTLRFAKELGDSLIFEAITWIMKRGGTPAVNRLSKQGSKSLPPPRMMARHHN